MKQHFNRIFSALLALVLCVGLLAAPAAAEEATSGTCGDNLTWSLDNGVLTISGSGAMTNFSSDNPAPWTDLKDRVQCVQVNDGVTSVGSMAFYRYDNLKIVNLANSVKSIGRLAFSTCPLLEQVSMPGVESLEMGCFYNCSSIVNITLPASLRSIGDKVFYRCTSLTAITIPKNVNELGDSIFCYCHNLVYVNILAPIDTIPYWCFYGCTMLDQVYLPSSLQSVESDAFSECLNLYYINHNGSDEVDKAIAEQLANKTISNSDGTKVSVSYEKTDGAVISTTTKTQVGDGDGITEPETGTTVNATVTDSSGWEDVADYIKDNNFRGDEPEIIIQTQSGTEIPEGSLEDLADKNVVLTIHTSDNVDWTVVIPHQDATSLGGAQDLSVTLAQNTSDKYSDTIGDAKSYIVTMGDTTLNATVLLPLGSETARQTATLYLVDGNELKKLSSVVVDDDGKAAFPLAGTEAGEYVVAINVQDITQDEVRIPEKLAAEYGIEYTYGATLTDAYGNQYVLTGRVNKLGIGVGELTLIIVGVLVGSIVVVGAVMFIWNKQQKKMYANITKK